MRDLTNLDIDYFKTIDTKEKAYWLGFLYADGYVDRKGRRLMLNLSIKDESQIDRFMSAVGLDSTLFKKYYGPYKTTGRFVQVYILHEQFVSNLISNGCTNRKTFTIRFPELNDELAAAFLLGYYDGDGSANSTVICCGAIPFLLDVKKRFNIEFNITSQKTSHYLNLGSELKRRLLQNYPYSMERKKMIYRGDTGLKTSCSSKSEYQAKIRAKRKCTRKFEVSKEDLENLINTMPIEHIGKMFGVTGKAIVKRAKVLGIVRTVRKYTRKK